MRGLACVLMFQTHCYDAWLGGDARKTLFLEDSQRLGTLPAPLFLFLAGISFALVTGKLARKNATPAQITRTMARRGAEIFAFGLLFRLQEYAIAWGWAPFSDLFRVDVLNIIGLSMILMALLCGLIFQISASRTSLFIKTSPFETSPVKTSASPPPAFQSPVPSAAHLTAEANAPKIPVIALASTALAVSAIIALLTPPLYTTWRPTWLPWQLESYIDGCHNLGSPQPWLFPLFPWVAFAFAGLAAGFILFSDWARTRTASILATFAAVGAAIILLARQLDHSSLQLYSVYDYWHTSPNFLMMRVGMLLMIAFLAYAWCQALARISPWAICLSPLIQLGQASLLVYWVHIEFVYGRFSILPKQAVGIATATRGLIEITVAMLILSILRTRIDWKKLASSLTERLRTRATLRPSAQEPNPAPGSAATQ